MLDAAPEGPLRGVPVVIKDEWPLPWRAERFGAAEMFGASPPGESGPYRALRDAGAVIAGVANMHEWGSSSTGNASVYGAARNPWDTERCPGGSSSGPGAAVGARIVAGAVGPTGSVDPLPGRLLRDHRAEADLRALGDGGPPHAQHDDDRLRADVQRRRRLPAAGLGALSRAAAGGDAGGCGSGSSPGDVSEDCSRPVRSACEEAIEALRERPAAASRRSSSPGLELSGLAAC